MRREAKACGERRRRAVLRNGRATSAAPRRQTRSEHRGRESTKSSPACCSPRPLHRPVSVAGSPPDLPASVSISRFRNGMGRNRFRLASMHEHSRHQHSFRADAGQAEPGHYGLARPTIVQFSRTTAITVYEIEMGIALLPAGRRRTALESSFADTLRDDLERRILPFYEDAAIMGRGPGA
jgi:hypothetical protein